MARIKTQQAFTALPNWIIEKQKRQPGWLSCHELCVLLVLQHFAAGAGFGDDVFPGQGTIAACAGISKSSVIRSIAGLVEKNLIEKIPRYDELGQKTNLYRLMIWDGLPVGDEPCLGPPPMSDRHPPMSDRHPPLVTQTPPPCHSDTRTRTIEQEPSNNKNPPISPRQPKQPPAGVDLPDWLEPYREPLTRWTANRKKKHKLEPELSTLTIRALEYANSLGILQEFCEYISEVSWVSLGFAGYKSTIDKIAKDNGVSEDRNKKPKMTPIVYTLH